MKSRNKWFYNLSIRRKIVLYIYLVISPILIVISLFVFVQNYQITLKTQQETNTKLVNSLEDSIKVMKADVEDFSIYICINNDVLNILKSDEPAVLNKDTKLWYNRAPMQMIEDMIASKGYTKTIAIYPENGIRPYLRCIDSSVYLASIEDLRGTDMYRQAILSKGESTWARVSKTDTGTYQANRSDKLVMYREIFDLSKKTPLGYMAIGMEADKIADLCKNAVQQDNEGVVILNRTGDELVRYGTVDEGILSYIQSKEYLSVDYRSRADSFDYGSYHVFCSQYARNGFIVCKMLPKSNSDSQIYNVALMPFLLLAGLLIGLWPLLVLVSNIIAKPLGRLSHAMNQFKQGDFSQQVPITANDEVGQVTECFNQMVLEIKELIDNNYVITLKEKESELNALQSQINPHFLYNTLDSLYWRAQNDGNEEIAEDIFALSQLFRLVLGQGKAIIAVRYEKELITRYLQIQKMRFSKRLEYEINIDEKILDYHIPKLILQPFVENAIIHGLEKTGNPGSIYVSGRLHDGYLEFIIKDTGAGMTEEQVKAIREADDTKRNESHRIGGYAIKNVMERLELKYRNHYQLNIESTVGIGTTVTIILPAEEKEA